MKLLCPACNRTVLSRRTPLCTFCRAALPPEMLFTPAEVEEIEAEERERARLRELREAERAERQEAARRMGDGGGGFYLMMGGFGGG